MYPSFSTYENIPCGFPREDTQVGYVYDPVYLRHDTGDHPENARRLEAIMSLLEKSGLLKQLVHIQPRPASPQELMLVHTPELVAMVQAVAQRGGGWLDADTVLSGDSYTAAIYAAGGVISAVDAVMKGEVNSAFALVRPPGHHATPARAMGFCLFNNVAVATRYALNRYGLERAAIIDFDVHHGNGTQEAFDADPRVLYISTHQYPYYPGSGRVEETGRGEAKGTKVNIPLPAGCGDAEYLQVFAQIIVPAVTRFRPQLIMVSAGYDIHGNEPLASMNVTTGGITRITGIIRGLAEKLCGGHLVFALEGGYDIEALSASVKATFEVLLGNDNIAGSPGELKPESTAPDIAALIKQVREVHTLP